MGDSRQTKRALADAMKRLMEQTPFSKISVGDICQACQMNRKSFYYHFRDKYDLVNWIFQSEFLSAVPWDQYDSPQPIIRALCFYFYENRAFYRNALTIEGQNSFQDYFRSIMAPNLQAVAEDQFGTDSPDADFFIHFCADALLAAIIRWLSSKNCMEPEKFTRLLQRSVRYCSTLTDLP